MYQTRPAVGKGVGVFATQTIPCGTCIVSEDPLLFLAQPTPLDVYKAFLDLRVTLQQEYLNLAYHDRPSQSPGMQMYTQNLDKLNKGSSPIKMDLEMAAKVVAIFENNNFKCEHHHGLPYSSGIFLHISRINHSCLPNASHCWNSSLMKRTVYAARDIVAGEEVTITYIGLLQGRSTRTEYLEKHYGFICACPTCDVESGFAKDSEERRNKLVALRHELSVNSYDSDSAEADQAAILSEMLQCLEAEGLIGWEKGEYPQVDEAHRHLRLGRVLEELEEPLQALEEFRKALDLAVSNFGHDYIVTQEVVEDLSRCESLLEEDAEAVSD